MTPDIIILYCSDCDPAKYVGIQSDEVFITLDLKSDEWIFKATCPKCGGEILNSRRAFR